MLSRAGAVAAAVIAAVSVSEAGAQAPLDRPSITVELGRADRQILLQTGISDVLALPRPAKTVIIGDPAVVEATLNGDTAVVLTGQRAGLTNLIILGESGDEITRTAVRVGPKEAKVLIRNGSQRQSYTCSPTCAPDRDETAYTTYYNSPWGTGTAVTTTGQVPPGLMTPPSGSGPAPTQPR